MTNKIAKNDGLTIFMAIKIEKDQLEGSRKGIFHFGTIDGAHVAIYLDQKNDLIFEVFVSEQKEAVSIKNNKFCDEPSVIFAAVENHDDGKKALHLKVINKKHGECSNSKKNISVNLDLIPQGGGVGKFKTDAVGATMGVSEVFSYERFLNQQETTASIQYLKNKWDIGGGNE